MLEKYREQNTTIQISRDLASELKELGKKGDTYTDVIKRELKEKEPMSSSPPMNASPDDESKGDVLS